MEGFPPSWSVSLGCTLVYIIPTTNMWQTLSFSTYKRLKRIVVLCLTTNCDWHNINDTFKTPYCFFTQYFVSVMQCIGCGRNSELIINKKNVFLKVIDTNSSTSQFTMVLTFFYIVSLLVYDVFWVATTLLNAPVHTS